MGEWINHQSHRRSLNPFFIKEFRCPAGRDPGSWGWHALRRVSDAGQSVVGPADAFGRVIAPCAWWAFIHHHPSGVRALVQADHFRTWFAARPLQPRDHRGVEHAGNLEAPKSNHPHPQCELSPRAFVVPRTAFRCDFINRYTNRVAFPNSSECFAYNYKVTLTRLIREKFPPLRSLVQIEAAKKLITANFFPHGADLSCRAGSASIVAFPPLIILALNFCVYKQMISQTRKLRKWADDSKLSYQSRLVRRHEKRGATDLNTRSCCSWSLSRANNSQFH